MADLDNFEAEVDRYRKAFDDAAASRVEVAVSKVQGARKWLVAFLNTAVAPVVATVLGADSKVAAAVAGLSLVISGGVYAVPNRRR